MSDECRKFPWRLLWALAQAVLLGFAMVVLARLVGSRGGNVSLVAAFLLVVWLLSAAVNLVGVFSAHRVSFHQGYVELESRMDVLEISDSDLVIADFKWLRFLIGSGVRVSSKTRGKGMTILRSTEEFPMIVKELRQRRRASKR
jgi:hypothetical protein